MQNLIHGRCWHEEAHDGKYMTEHKLGQGRFFICENQACLHRIEWHPVCPACHVPTKPPPPIGKRKGDSVSQRER